MGQALSALALYGVIIMACVLLLVGILAANRSRRPPGTPKAPQEPPALFPSQAPAPSPSLATPAPIQLYLETDGQLWLEIEGRRYSRIGDMGDHRLAERALQAVGAMQRFAGIAPAVPQAELSDALRAGRQPSDGSFVVEYRGRTYRRISEIEDGQVGNRMLALISELVTFTQGLVAPASAAAAGASELQSPPMAQEEFIRRLSEPVAAPTPIKMPSLIESMRRPAPKIEAMPVGIAGQIDEILQVQLLSNAALVSRSIHVVTAKDGSFNVEADGQLLHWPDGVTAPLVREAVQKAIQTWERT
jgi:hypothetical protein